MPFMENKLQMIDLIGALEAGRRRKDMEEERRQAELQNKLLQEQIKSAQWENLTAREVPTMTVPSSGLTGMPTKKFLHEMPGYISGVDPKTVFQEWNENFRRGLGGGGGYGGGGGGQTQQDPYSNYAPGQLKEMNAINEYQPQQAKPQSTDIAALLGQLYGPGETGGQNLGGGSIKDPTTGTYKEFSELPSRSVGTITDLAGNQGPTGVGAAEDYVAGKAGAEDVNKILRDRAARAEKEKTDQMLYSNDNYIKLDTKKQENVRKELPQFKKELESRNMPFTSRAIELLIAKIKAQK